jgi:hypothetical protein
MALVVLIALALQLAVFGTQYCSFRDIYGLDAAPPEPGPGQPGDSQLLA